MKEETKTGHGTRDLRCGIQDSFAGYKFDDVIKMDEEEKRKKDGKNSENPNQDRQSESTTCWHSIELFPAEGGIRQSLQKWLELQNSSGRIIASMPDIYRFSKECRLRKESGEQGIDDIVECFRDDCQLQNGVITNTKMWTIPNKKMEITHYCSQFMDQYGNRLSYNITEDIHRQIVLKNRTPIKNILYSGRSITNVAILEFVQKILATEDTPEEIIRNMEFIAGLPGERIQIDTTTLKQTREEPHILQLTYNQKQTILRIESGSYGRARILTRKGETRP